MRRKLQYFIFNKDLDYRRGCLDNMEYDKDGIWVSEQDGNNRGIFISRILDSQEDDMEWHRLVLKLNDTKNAIYKISIYCSNYLQLEQGGEILDMEKVLRDVSVSMEKKLDLIAPYLQKTVTGMGDLLLHEVKGRYLWLAIEAYQQMQERIKFQEIKIYFPRQSWISYLPEIYQGSDKNTFLERYLGIFQTLYEDLNQEIKDVPFFLDVAYTEKEFLDWIAEWLDIADSYMWSEEQLRELLKQAVTLYRMRGTKQSVMEFVKLYTGEEPYLVEYHTLEPIKRDKKQEKILTQLYGDNQYVFSVVVKEKYVPTVREYKTLVRIIEEVKPAYMELNLIVLKPYIFLNQHSYLGINSVLGQYRNITLDGLSLLPFSVIGEKEI